jgi:hypothetical protein
MSTRTLRGTITEGTTRRIIVDDGRINHGYRVTSFYVATRNPANIGHNCFGTLSLDEEGGLIWNWDDNRQIAWAGTPIIGQGTSAFNHTVGAPFAVIAPDHVVLQDLYVTAQLGSGTTEAHLVNYLITLEPITLTDNEAILTLIKERSQDDWGR